MDYKALNFLEFAELDDRVRVKLRYYFGVDDENEAAEKWRCLTTDHDDQAADVLAVATALSRVGIQPADSPISALDLVDGFHLLAGDRLYATLSRELFEAWKPKARFHIELASGGKPEKGKVWFNHGQLGASLHDGFDIQGVTKVNRIPRIQWNYRCCDSLADIDLDGYSPWDIRHHLTYANSDPRQWHDEFVCKFGSPGYEIENVGDVPEIRVRDTSTCPCPPKKNSLSAGKQTAALAIVSDVIAALETTDGFRGVVQAAASTLVGALRDVEQSPLLSEVSADVLVGSNDEDLLGYYAARVNVDRLMRVSPLVVRLATEAVLPLAAFSTEELPISNSDELRTMRRLLEEEEDRQRRRIGSLDPRLRSSIAPLFGARTWLSTDNQAVFGYPAGTRFVAAETGDLQLLFAPRNGEYDLLFAVPRSKY